MEDGGARKIGGCGKSVVLLFFYYLKLIFIIKIMSCYFSWLNCNAELFVIVKFKIEEERITLRTQNQEFWKFIDFQYQHFFGPHS